ncbi:hypothetical protein Tco_0218077 [Tanacetum coccineum]
MRAVSSLDLRRQNRTNPNLARTRRHVEEEDRDEHLEHAAVKKTLSKLKAQSSLKSSPKKAPMIQKPFKKSVNTVNLMTITQTTDYLKRSIWYLDSGCSRHMIGIKEYLHRYSKESCPKVVFGDQFLEHIEAPYISQLVRRDVYVIDMSSFNKESNAVSLPRPLLVLIGSGIRDSLTSTGQGNTNNLAKHNHGYRIVGGLRSLNFILRQKPVQAFEKEASTICPVHITIIGTMGEVKGLRWKDGEDWEGIDYEKTFAPVARLEAIRIFLAYAAYMGFMMLCKEGRWGWKGEVQCCGMGNKVLGGGGLVFKFCPGGGMGCESPMLPTYSGVMDSECRERFMNLYQANPKESHLVAARKKTHIRWMEWEFRGGGDATKSLEASESAEVQGNQPLAADATKYQQLLQDEEVLRETLEDQARAEKEWEERIKKEQAEDELFRLKFGVQSNSKYKSD